jgi:hypothetical protein
VYERIQAGYRHRFRTLLARVRPRRLEFGVELLMRRAGERAAREGRRLPEALAGLYEDTRRRVARRVALMRSCSTGSASEPSAPEPFLCDASLGGLARWLRAAGFEALALERFRGDALLREAARRGGTLLTTDALLLDRRLVAGGGVATVWIPTGLRPPEQLALLVRDLDLRPREPRCMACGGELRPVDKESVRERIPPRTARWKDEYFVCAACDRLFWRGTHWERIASRLRGAVEGG